MRTKEWTEKELQNKAERYCLQAERCCSEVEQKLSLWGASPQVTAAIMEGLLRDRFIDEARFACAFAKDKMRYNQWGRVKISMALREKKIDRNLIEDALCSWDEDEYLSVLQKVLRSKMRSVKARDSYEARQKVIRFGLGRGFDMKEILQCLTILSEEGDEEYPD